MVFIRAARQQDAEGISALLCACYAAFAETDGWPANVVDDVVEARGSVLAMSRLLCEESVFVAVAEGQTVGIVSLNGNEVTKLFVAPGRQRHGIGTLLFQQAESFLAARGASSLRLGAAVKSALPFWEKMRMQVTGQRAISCGPCRDMTVTLMRKRLY